MRREDGRVDLGEFLMTRIAEDEAVARAAHYEGQRWYAEEEIVDRWPECDCGTPVMTANRKDEARFVADWHPARILAECDAKRRIVAEHAPIDPCDAHDASFETMPCDTLRFLALPYADHPDYRDEWRP